VFKRFETIPLPLQIQANTSVFEGIIRGHLFIP